MEGLETIIWSSPTWMDSSTKVSECPVPHVTLHAVSCAPHPHRRYPHAGEDMSDEEEGQEGEGDEEGGEVEVGEDDSMHTFEGHTGRLAAATARRCANLAVAAA